jgi:DNA polymerase III sliding clamp (beta) subunit (PCNA family)
MIAKKSDLLAALETPVRITHTRFTTTPLRLLLSAQNGRLEISASSGNDAAVERIPVTGELEPVCVSPNDFKNTIEMGGDEVSLEVESSSLLRYRSGRRSVGLSVFNPDEFQHVKLNGTLAAVPAALLADGLESVADFACKNESRYILKSVHVVGTAKSLTAESSDGKQYANYTTAAICSDCDFLIPLEYVDGLIKALRRPGADLSLSEKQVAVIHEAGHYLCPQLEGIYPNTSKHIPEMKSKLGNISRDEWLDLMRCINSLRVPEHEKEMVPVHLNFEADHCEIRSEGRTPFEQVVDGAFEPAMMRMNSLPLERVLAAFPEKSTLTVTHDVESKATAFLEGDLRILSTQLRS